MSILDKMSKNMKVKIKKPRKIKRKYEITSTDNIKIIKEKLKPKIQLKTQRMRGWEKWAKFFRYNKIFQDDPKMIYREIENESINIKDIHTATEELKSLKTRWIEKKKETN